MFEPGNIYFVLLLLAGAIILISIPKVGKLFRVLNTLFHETGHGLMTMLTSGQVIKIELFQDTSGTTRSLAPGKLRQFFIALAGYIFASATAYLFFFLISRNYYLGIWLVIAIVFIINLIFFVRNGFGILWLLLAGAGLVLVFLYGNILARYVFSIVFAGILLADSLRSAFVIFLLSLRTPDKAGDTTLLKKITHIPAFFWGFLFLIQAAGFTILSLACLFPSLNRLFSLSL